MSGDALGDHAHWEMAWKSEASPQGGQLLGPDGDLQVRAGFKFASRELGRNTGVERHEAPMVIEDIASPES